MPDDKGSGPQDIDWSELESEFDGEGEDRAAFESNLEAIRRISSFNAPKNPIESKSQGEDAHPVPDEEIPPPMGNWCGLELLEPIGMGAHARVYRARNPRLDHIVALKIQHDSLDSGQLTGTAVGPRRSASEVIKEARAMARVQHKNVVTVYDANVDAEGHVGIWMEYIKGQTLSDIIRQQKKLGAGEASTIGRQLCEALAAIHAVGIVHQDVKAQNVMRKDGGEYVLMDFGVAIQVSEDAKGKATGTPSYMAPEALLEGEVSRASDIYSMGVLLFHMVTERFPVEADNMGELIAQHRLGQRELLKDLRPDLPQSFIDVVEKALHPDRGQRFRSMGEMHAALKGRLIPWRKILRSSMAAAAAVILVAGALKVKDCGQEPQPDPPMIRSALSSDGRSFTSDLSPEGNLLALVRKDGGRYSLFLKRLDTDTEECLVPAGDRAIGAVVFAGASAQVCFAMAEASGGEVPEGRSDLYVLPSDGGTPVRIRDNVLATWLACSPDGSRLAYGRTLGETTQILVCGLDGSGERVVANLPGAPSSARALAWSRDGRTIFAVLLGASSDSEEIVALSVSRGSLVSTAFGSWRSVRAIESFRDRPGLLVLGVRDDGESVGLWRFADGTKEPEPLVDDGASYSHVSASGDGGRIVLHAVDESRLLRMIPENYQSNETWLQRERPERSYADVAINRAAGGGVLWLSSDELLADLRAGPQIELARLNLTDRSWLPVARVPGEITAIDRASDGRLACAIRTGDDHSIWLLDPAGASLSPLDAPPGHVRYPRFSPDGAVLYYCGRASAGELFYVYAYSFNEGTSRRISDIPALAPLPSPDGRRLMALFGDGTGADSRLGLLDLASGELEFPELREGFHPLAWWPLDRAPALVGYLRDASIPDLWLHPLDGSPAFPFTEFPPGDYAILGCSWRPTLPKGSAIILAMRFLTYDALLLQAQASGE